MNPDIEREYLDASRSNATVSSDAVQRPGRSDLTHAADLDRIAVRIEGFLSNQAERLVDLIERCRECLAREELTRQLMDVLEEDKKQWESRRDAELLEIEEERSRLIAAWERLESEERRLACHAASSTSQPRPIPAGDGNSVTAPQPAAIAPASSDMPVARPSLSAAETTVSRLQFEQLKREIRNHMRRSRKSK